MIIVGGLAGSWLAIALAREGVDVLLVERERVFRDRVRGVVMAARGTAEAKLLGLFELLRERCAIEVRYLTYHVGLARRQRARGAHSRACAIHRGSKPKTSIGASLPFSW